MFRPHGAQFSFLKQTHRSRAGLRTFVPNGTGKDVKGVRSCPALTPSHMLTTDSETGRPLACHVEDSL
jgi:hypothetical protein